MATQSPSSVVMVLADAMPKPSTAGSSTSRDTTATHVAQESKSAAEGGGLCVVKKGDVKDAPLPPRSDSPGALAEAPSTPKTPQTPVSSVRYVGDNADHDGTSIAEEQEEDADEDDGDSSSEEEEYERTPTGASQFLPPDTTDTYQESPVKFRPVVVLEKESQRSPRKKLMDNNEYVEGGKGRSTEADGLESIGLPTIDEAMMGPSSANESKSSGTRPPLSGSAAGKNNNRRSRKSTASGSSSSRGGSGRTSTTNTTGGDILTAILDRTLTFMGCASTSNAFSCGRTGSKKSAASCRCGGGGADDHVLWDGDIDDTATVNSVHVPSPRASPRASPKQMADLNGRVQIQMRTSAAVGDSTVAHQAARAAAAATASGEDKSLHNKTNRKKNTRGIPTGGCTGTGGKYVASSPLTTTVPFDANDLSTIVPDASDAHHLPANATAGGECTASPKSDTKMAKTAKGDDDDDDDEALLSPTHFFRPVSFDIDESSLAGSIAGSLASAIRGVR